MESEEDDEEDDEEEEEEEEEVEKYKTCSSVSETSTSNKGSLEVSSNTDIKCVVKLWLFRNFKNLK